MKIAASLIMALLLVAAASALPDSGTRRSGDLCEMGHPFKYSYSFAYGNSMEIGTATDLTITFSLSGALVSRSPHSVQVEVEASGFEVNETRFTLTADKRTIVLRPLTESPSLILKTTLTLDGDEPPHRGYSATYSDTFTLDTFNVAAATTTTQRSTTSSRPESTAITTTRSETTTTQGSTSSTILGSTTSTLSEVTTSSLTTGTTIIEVVVEQSEPSPAAWYITRAAGLVAYLFLSLSVAVGLLRRISPKTRLFRRHCDISYLALIFTAIHILNTLLDKYMWNLTFEDIMFPGFSSNIRIMLSAGVLAFYLMLAVTLTSASPKLISYLKRRRWHLLHLTSYCMYLIVVAHSFVIGTDLGNSRLSDLPSTLIYAGFWLLAFINFILLAIFFGIRRGRK